VTETADETGLPTVLKSDWATETAEETGFLTALKSDWETEIAEEVSFLTFLKRDWAMDSNEDRGFPTALGTVRLVTTELRKEVTSLFGAAIASTIIIQESLVPMVVPNATVLPDQSPFATVNWAAASSALVPPSLSMFTISEYPVPAVSTVPAAAAPFPFPWNPNTMSFAYLVETPLTDGAPDAAVPVSGAAESHGESVFAPETANATMQASSVEPERVAVTVAPERAVVAIAYHTSASW